MNRQKLILGNQVLMEGVGYSEWVFTVYANYVDISVKVLEFHGISQEKRDAISSIAEKVRNLGEKLAPAYTYSSCNRHKCRDHYPLSTGYSKDNNKGAPYEPLRYGVNSFNMPSITILKYLNQMLACLSR